MHISFYKRWSVITLVCYIIVLVFFLKVPKADNSFDNLKNQSLPLQGEVVSYPTYKNGKTTFILKLDKTFGNKKIYAYCFKEECKNILRGSLIFYTGKLETLPEQTNYGSFDWSLFLRRKNIVAQTRILEINQIQTGNYFWLNISKIRQSILGVFEKNFGKELLPIISGITIGEKGDISPSLYSDFQDSGAMHLLVASGGNVGFVTLIVYFLCSLFGFKRIQSAGTALILALFYTLIAGADAPLLRAYLMAFCSTVGFILGRKSGLLQGLVLAALMILIVNPQSLFEAGFQMSFLATLSIMLFATNFKISNKLPRYLKVLTELFLISLIAQISLLPVFCNYFHKISLTAPLSNILLIPLSGVLMGGGFILWIISFIHFSFLIKSVVFILNLLLIDFKFLVEFFASLPISKIIVPSLNPFIISGFYLLFFAFLNLPLIKNKKRFCFIVCSCSIFLFCASFYFGNNKTVLLKGRYNFTLIDKQRNLTRVFGAGVKGDALRSALLSLGTKEIDCLLAKGTSGSLYALKDLEDIKIKKIYLFSDFINDKSEALLNNISAEKEFIWAAREYCGVKILKEENLNFSYQTDKIKAFDNMKKLFMEGKEIKIKGN